MSTNTYTIVNSATNEVFTQEATSPVQALKLVVYGELGAKDMDYGNEVIETSVTYALGGYITPKFILSPQDLLFAQAMVEHVLPGAYMMVETKVTIERTTFDVEDGVPVVRDIESEVDSDLSNLGFYKIVGGLLISVELSQDTNDLLTAYAEHVNRDLD